MATQTPTADEIFAGPDGNALPAAPKETPEAPQPEATEQKPTAETAPEEPAATEVEQPATEPEYIPIDLHKEFGLAPGVDDDTWETIEKHPNWKARENALFDRWAGQEGSQVRRTEANAGQTLAMLQALHAAATQGDEAAQKIQFNVNEAQRGFLDAFWVAIKTDLNQKIGQIPDSSFHKQFFLPYLNSDATPNYGDMVVRYGQMMYELGQQDPKTRETAVKAYEFKRKKEQDAGKLRTKAANTPADVTGKSPSAPTPNDEEILQGKANTPEWFAAYERKFGQRAPMDDRPL